MLMLGRETLRLLKTEKKSSKYSNKKIQKEYSNKRIKDGGDNGTRTHNLRLAKPMLFQLSYIPKTLLLEYFLVGY